MNAEKCFFLTPPPPQVQQLNYIFRADVSVVTYFKVEMDSMNVPYRGLDLSATFSQCFQLGLLNLRNSFIPPFSCRLTPALLC